MQQIKIRVTVTAGLIAIDGFPTRVDVSGRANLASIRGAEPTEALAVDTRAGTHHVVTNNIAAPLQVPVAGVGSLAMTRGWSIGSPADLRARLSELEAERIFARSCGMAADAAYMTDLEDEVAEVTAIYIGAAVTELATLRSEFFGPQLG